MKGLSGRSESSPAVARIESPLPAVGGEESPFPVAAREEAGGSPPAETVPEGMSVLAGGSFSSWSEESKFGSWLGSTAAWGVALTAEEVPARKA